MSERSYHRATSRSEFKPASIDLSGERDVAPTDGTMGRQINPSWQTH